MSPRGAKTLLARAQARPVRSEKAEQQLIKELLARLSIRVYDTSQPFAAKITPGVPDLLCFCPKRGFFAVEVKRAGGRQTPAQRQFQADCMAAHIPYILGPFEAVVQFLNRPIPPTFPPMFPHLEYPRR